MEFRKVGIPILAIIGLSFALFIVYYESRKAPPAPVLFPPPISPYPHYIAAEGTIESIYKNISIGSSFADIITDIYVKVGDIVKKRDPLFRTDVRQFEAMLAEALKDLDLAKTYYEEKKTQFSFYERLKDKTATSEQAYTSALYAMQLAKETVDQTIAAVNVIKMDIERSTVRAPIDGEVLQLNARPGAFANVNPVDEVPLIIFGDTDYYHLRIDIDEEDEWRYETASAATAFVRGNAALTIPLEYVYTEPFIVAKVQLTGSDTERVDTRVLQVVYRFSKTKFPVYTGQLLDVFLAAKED